jgi:uncharacterized membrane protein
MGNWIIKFLGTAILIHGLLIWTGPEIVMRKLDRDLEEAKIFVSECGERWVDGIFYINPSCLSNKQSARKPNPDFLYFLIPYDLSNGDLFVSTPVPLNDRYWSIHAHNRNTDAFYRITNTEIHSFRTAIARRERGIDPKDPFSDFWLYCFSLETIFQNTVAVPYNNYRDLPLAVP